MYKRLLSPKVYSRETDLTVKSPKIKKNPKGTGSSGGSGGGGIPIPPSGFYLLLEDGSYLLLEDNFKILL
jgi:hypothetical protein